MFRLTKFVPRGDGAIDWHEDFQSRADAERSARHRISRHISFRWEHETRTVRLPGDGWLAATITELT